MIEMYILWDVVLSEMGHKVFGFQQGGLGVGVLERVLLSIISCFYLSYLF